MFLWCNRCKIHRYVAALSFEEPMAMTFIAWDAEWNLRRLRILSMSFSCNWLHPPPPFPRASSFNPLKQLFNYFKINAFLKSPVDVYYTPWPAVERGGVGAKEGFSCVHRIETNDDYIHARMSHWYPAARRWESMYPRQRLRYPTIELTYSIPIST